VDVRYSAKLRQGSRDRLRAVVSGHALDQDGFGSVGRRGCHARAPLGIRMRPTRSRSLSARGIRPLVIRDQKHSYLEILSTVKPFTSRLLGPAGASASVLVASARSSKEVLWTAIRGTPELGWTGQGFLGGVRALAVLTPGRVAFEAPCEGSLGPRSTDRAFGEATSTQPHVTSLDGRGDDGPRGRRCHLREPSGHPDRHRSATIACGAGRPAGVWPELRAVSRRARTGDPGGTAPRALHLPLGASPRCGGAITRYIRELQEANGIR